MILRLTGAGILREVEASRVRLPHAVGDRYEVYVNGVRQAPGRDFDPVGGGVGFSRGLGQEGRLGPIRWLSMLLGIAGTYRKHETVDVVYEIGGRRTVASLRAGSAPGGVCPRQFALLDRLEAIADPVTGLDERVSRRPPVDLVP